MAELPRGTVTFLFTDIEGSTRLWQGHHGAMVAAYARHDTLLREAITQHGGVVYKVIGDALQVAFPTAPQAVSAALAAQLGLQGEEWTALALSEPLRVRMALHTGAVDPDLDGDYRSPVLNRLGRLLGAGHGGQVLLSTVTAELTRDWLPAGAGMRDLGDHRLKDLGRPERVFQVDHPALAGEFPSLATLDIQPHNLPVQPTPLIGRKRELAQLTDLLGQPEVRLLTLTGPGGTGKTRLVLQAAAEVVEDVPDGVWFVDLSPLSDPALVPSAIAGVLGVREEGGTPLVEVLQEYLRDKNLLLVLDNLEQLLPGAAAGIGALLSATPHLTVLATSRVPLRLRAEREVAVPPLGLPRRKPPPTLAQLGQYEAVRLFIARAEAVKADFTVTSANAPAVTEICHRLDGLPLAIELAAARVRMLPPEVMLRRLEQRLKVLTGGARDLPLRQQTLRGAIAWSYELLSSDEQALFRRLSVFAGGASFEAIEAVVAAEELDFDVFEGLEQLVEHSLVRQTEVEGEPRFGMLETIREYGLEELEAQGEAQEAHTHHAAYFLALTEGAEPELIGLAPERWMDRLEIDHDNLRGALGWSLKHEEETALRLAGALGRFWHMRGHITEGRTWLAQAREVAPEADPAVRAKGLEWAGVLAIWQEHADEAERLTDEALRIYRILGDQRGIGEMLLNLGLVADLQGDLDRTMSLTEESLCLAREVGDQRLICLVQNALGYIHCLRGDLAQARPALEEALLLARQLGNRRGQLLEYVLHSVGELCRAERDLRGAEAAFREALALAWKHRVWVMFIECLEGLGAIAAASGEWHQVARLLAVAEAHRREIGFPMEQGLRAEYEQTVAALRQALGEEAFRAVWEEGKARSLEEVVAEALAAAEEIADGVGTEDAQLR